jgi:hypothetical protein
MDSPESSMRFKQEGNIGSFDSPTLSSTRSEDEEASAGGPDHEEELRLAGLRSFELNAIPRGALRLSKLHNLTVPHCFPAEMGQLLIGQKKQLQQELDEIRGTILDVFGSAVSSYFLSLSRHSIRCKKAQHRPSSSLHRTKLDCPAYLDALMPSCLNRRA